jgi:hypothetical protein
MDDDVVAEGESTGVSDHRAKEFDSFLVGRYRVNGGDAIATGEDCIHATVGCIADIAFWGITELIVPISIGQAFAYIGFQLPGSYHGAASGRLASFHAFQDDFPVLGQCFR